MSEVEILVFDIGSTYTKGIAYGEDGYLARAQSPTTVEDIEIGLQNVRKKIAENLDKEEINADEVLSTSSAAGGLRMVAVGYMPRVTAKAAKEVAMASGAKILEIISDEENSEFKKEILKETAPDIVLLAGGTDGGNDESLYDNARLIIESGVKATIILAGNIKVQPDVKSLLIDSGYNVKCVANVMPTIHQLNTGPARKSIHEEFIKQITDAQGLSGILNMITNDTVIPTPGSVLLAAELLAKGTYEKEGIGNLILIDMGGATTDIHSIIPDLDEMDDEEKGLIVSDEKQSTFRTVEGNLGLRVSVRGIVDTVGEKTILKRVDIESDPDDFKKYIKKISENPEYIAQTEKEKEYDFALAISAIEIALKRHAGYMAKEYRPEKGIVPGTPIGRDLRGVDTVICVGGIFAHLSQLKVEKIVKKAFANKGISLLPETFNVYCDRYYSLFSIGALSEKYPEKSLQWGLKQINYTK